MVTKREDLFLEKLSKGGNFSKMNKTTDKRHLKGGNGPKLQLLKQTTQKELRSVTPRGAT